MVVVNDGREAITTKFHCIKCGRIWGDGIDVDSFGLCIHCFAEWAKCKNKCFGIETLKNKQHCSLNKFCKEYYGIR